MNTTTLLGTGTTGVVATMYTVNDDKTINEKHRNQVIGTAIATSATTVIAKCGRGSMCHRDYLKFRANNTSTELWILPVKENSAGVAATGKLTLAGTATADGILQLYINATRVQVPVASGDTASATIG